MALNRGLDQMSAWILAVVASGAVFGGGHLLTKLTTRHADAGAEGEGHGEHGEEHGDEHAAAAEHGGEHDAAAAEHGGEHGAAAHDEHAKSEHGDEHAAKSEHGDEHAAAHDSSGDKPDAHAAKAAHAGVHWDYKGSASPEHWGDLADEYKTCATGHKQSPVDISGPGTSQKLLPIRFHYKESDAVLKNNGHTIQADMQSGNFVEIDGERYDLLQFHFHTPSEHKVENAPYDMELHLVHRNAEGRLAVIGVLFAEGAASKPLAPLWKNLPAANETAPEPIALDPSSLLPSRRLYWHYEGSLTTPPCTEGVQWYVLTTPLQASTKQVDQFAHLIPFNARPVQALHGRKLVKSAR